MKQAAKPTHHAPPRKPFKERHQMVITCGTFLALLAVGIWYLGTQVPYAPLPDKPVNTAIRGPR